MRSGTLGDGPSVIDRCDEAPAPEPASAADFIRRPNRHMGEVRCYLP
jgi:hypothetical protein